MHYHQQRLSYTHRSHYNNGNPPQLKDYIHVPPEFQHIYTKCRVVYDEHIKQIKYSPYKKKQISSLKLVETKEDYSFKHENRGFLHRLYDSRAKADDILIIKAGMITDTYYCNVALLKAGKWHTPVQPLLKGCMRQHLLDKGIIEMAEISANQIYDYEKISLFNALVNFGEICFDIDPESIH